MMKAVLVTAFLLSGSGAAAQGTTDLGGTRLGPSNLPSQIVCIRETRIGSRLDTHKVCRTRAEWREHRRMYRENIERAQNQRGSMG